jgi:hypothetical protein
MDVRVVGRGMLSEYDFRCRSYIRRGDNQSANNYASNGDRCQRLPAIGNIPHSMHRQNLLRAF